MPKRMVDGESLWRSAKLRNVPLEFRSEYANLIPLAEADGTFEADARMVWSNVYSYNRDDVTVDLVEDILEAFESAGMLVRKADEAGKMWGILVGIEARLPPESQRDKYKQGKAYLFQAKTESIPNVEQVKSDSTAGLAQVYVGLDRFGIGLDSDRSGKDAAAVSENRDQDYKTGLYMGTNPKKLHKSLVEVWQAVKGPQAIARYPSRYPAKWEETCENISAELIMPAFELWAKEEGLYSNTEYPVMDFVKVASKYIERILPTKKAERPDPYAALKKIQDADAEKYRAAKEAEWAKEEALAAETEGMI